MVPSSRTSPRRRAIWSIDWCVELRMYFRRIIPRAAHISRKHRAYTVRDYFEMLWNAIPCKLARGEFDILHAFDGDWWLIVVFFCRCAGDLPSTVGFVQASQTISAKIKGRFCTASKRSSWAFRSDVNPRSIQEDIRRGRSQLWVAQERSQGSTKVIIRTRAA